MLAFWSQHDLRCMENAKKGSLILTSQIDHFPILSFGAGRRVIDPCRFPSDLASQQRNPPLKGLSAIK